MRPYYMKDIPMNAPKLSTVKTVVNLVTAKSVTFCVASAVTALVPTENQIQKIEVFVGSYAIASLVSAKVTAHVGREIDSVVEQFQAMQARIEAT